LVVAPGIGPEEWTTDSSAGDEENVADADGPRPNNLVEINSG
jgi:hypothetical protein